MTTLPKEIFYFQATSNSKDVYGIACESIEDIAISYDDSGEAVTLLGRYELVEEGRAQKTQTIFVPKEVRGKRGPYKKRAFKR